MRTLRLSRFRLDWLRWRILEANTPVKAPLREERASSPLPPVLAEEPIQDWERLWIDLGGEG
jgi:hypothetical protein